MDTYWVKSKKTGHAASQTMLNPFQRQKVSVKSTLKVPIPPSRPSSPPPLSPGLVAGVNSYLSHHEERNGGRIVSPKPDEWPIADHRLNHLEERRRGDGDRRNTLPSVQYQPVVIQRQLGGPGGGGGLPLADTSSLLDRRNTITTMDPREMQQAVIHSHPPGRQSVSSANSTWSSIPTWNVAGQMSPRDSVVPETPRLTFPSPLSEYNLMHVRDSLTQPLPVAEEGVVSHSHLSVFAAMAEETARQARKVADWAAYIAKAKSITSRDNSSDKLSEEGHGSSVDADTKLTCPLAKERTSSHSEKARQGSSDEDTVFEALNGVCPVRHTEIDRNDESDKGIHHHDNPHNNCSIM